MGKEGRDRQCGEKREGKRRVRGVDCLFSGHRPVPHC